MFLLFVNHAPGGFRGIIFLSLFNRSAVNFERAASKQRQAAGNASRTTQAYLGWGVAGSFKVRNSVYSFWPHPV